MQTFSIQTQQHPYSMYIGTQLFQQIPNWILGKQAFFLVDEKLAEQASLLQKVFSQAGWTCFVKTILVEEKAKSFESIYPLYEEMLKAKLDRNSVLFAVGGGVIGDIGGFLAGTYFRGIRWVCVPTTLLAQVDSAIGGKTGINHTLGKNVIGLIYQPNLVVADLSWLSSLPMRERISGLGEMIKYGLLFDENLYQKLSLSFEQIILLDPNILEETITLCAKWKASIIEQDEQEIKGTRELLNFGHSVGHALESITHYDYFRHGEAVLWGMRAELFLSKCQGFLSSQQYQELEDFFAKLPLPSLPAYVLPQNLIESMKHDKKNKEGLVRIILLHAIGKPKVHSFSENELLPLITAFLAQHRTSKEENTGQSLG